MDSENKENPGNENDAPEETPQQDAPADALSKTPDELEEEQAAKEAESGEKKPDDDDGEKKVSPIKKFLRRVNVYLLFFILLLVVLAAITIVSYLNSQKEPPDPNIAGQELTTEELKELGNKDATVGGATQTLTIKGNAVIEGQTLTRGNLNVAGSLQTGGALRGPSLTISGDTNLGATQINSLQVAETTAVTGELTAGSLNVSGATSLGGNVVAPQLSVTRLIISGNGVLQVPNHISFTGPTPNRSFTSSVLGHGGSAAISGSDTSGTLNINTGTNPGPKKGCFIEVAFRTPFTKTPRVLITPVGKAGGLSNLYVTRSLNNFSVCFAKDPPAEAHGESFQIDYFVAG